MAEQKIALVTGANKGIGYEVARQLAGRGYIVWLGARDAERGMAAAAKLGSGVTFLPLDVTSDESVEAAVKQVKEVSGHLDVLVNNAGIAGDSGISPVQVKMPMIRETFEVNVFACIRMTLAFLPLLRESSAARIVMVSSDLGSQTHRSNPAFPFRGFNPVAYSSSKAALNAVTISFATELEKNSIKVNAANPGFTATDINGHSGTNSVEQGASPIIALATLADDGPTGTFLGPNGPEPW